MEKRLLLAFLLSFLILSIWGRLNPQPKQPLLQDKTLQPAEDKYVKAAKEIAPMTADVEAPIEVREQQAFEQKMNLIENDFLRVELTNQGGKIDNIVLKEHNVSLPIKDIFTISQFDKLAFVAEGHQLGKIVYAGSAGGLNIRKVYELGEDYIIKAYVEIERTARDVSLSSLEFGAFTMDISRMDNIEGNGRDKSLLEYAIAKDDNVQRKGNAFKFNSKESKMEAGPINWIGFRDRYFCAVFKPEFHVENYKINNIDEKVQSFTTIAKVSQEQGARYGGIIYFGPQKLELLKSYDLGIEKIMIFSGWGPLDGISKAIYALMNWTYKIIPNWGVCIIIISLVIYGAMYPLTMKGMSSMKKMQSLQPKITALREQFKHNPQKLNKEIMELYQKHKINPLGGCFPLLLQMPVFIGLYQVLWRSVSFKGAQFLWIKDLSEPDRLFILPTKLPLIGNELNILPIVMIIVMVLQQKISAKNMVVTDPAQASQQKMMMTIFPLFIGFIFYKFASGLCLYFTIFYLLSTFTQWKMSKVKHAI